MLSKSGPAVVTRVAPSTNKQTNHKRLQRNLCSHLHIRWNCHVDREDQTESKLRLDDFRQIKQQCAPSVNIGKASWSSSGLRLGFSSDMTIPPNVWSIKSAVKFRQISRQSALLGFLKSLDFSVWFCRAETFYSLFSDKTIHESQDDP